MANAPIIPTEPNPAPPAPPASNPPAPNPPAPATPPAETSEAKATRLEKELKDKDSKIADLETTNSTLQTRFSQINPAPGAPQPNGNGHQPTPPTPPSGNAQVDARVQEILENSTFNPQEAAKKMGDLLREVQTGAAKSAVQEALRTIQTQNTYEKLRNEVKSSLPDFDDDVINVVMDKADELARSGKYKTAQEAIEAAKTFVKSKFDGYAAKLKNVPALPAGAVAETGNNPAPTPPVEEKIEEPNEVLEKRQDAKTKKIL